MSVVCGNCAATHFIYFEALMMAWGRVAKAISPIHRLSFDGYPDLCRPHHYE
ncbi:MAG: hypothetical protein MJA27_24875 [Pseudanabaenales cyanobacterium]|nr:hypothetical protein [Pseudanabaenales cyanobacterium]